MAEHYKLESTPLPKKDAEALQFWVVIQPGVVGACVSAIPDSAEQTVILTLKNDSSLAAATAKFGVDWVPYVWKGSAAAKPKNVFFRTNPMDASACMEMIQWMRVRKGVVSVKTQVEEVGDRNPDGSSRFNTYSLIVCCVNDPNMYGNVKFQAEQQFGVAWTEYTPPQDALLFQTQPISSSCALDVKKWIEHRKGVRSVKICAEGMFEDIRGWVVRVAFEQDAPGLQIMSDANSMFNLTWEAI